MVKLVLPLALWRNASNFLYSNPLRASSIFLAASPTLYPPFDTQIALPSPSSTLSSTAGKGHGQWCGKWTHASVPGHK